MSSQIPLSPLIEAVSSLTIEEGSHSQFSARISKEWTTQQYVIAFNSSNYIQLG